MFDRHILDKPWRDIFTLEIKYIYKYLYDIQVNNKENVPLNFLQTTPWRASDKKNTTTSVNYIPSSPVLAKLSSPKNSLRVRFLLYQALGKVRISDSLLMSYLNAAIPMSHTAAM
jgi:hypothetical protein